MRRKMEGKKSNEMDVSISSHKSYIDENESTMKTYLKSTASVTITLLFPKKSCFSFGVKGGTVFPWLLEFRCSQMSCFG